jgi:hypothetical protein
MKEKPAPEVLDAGMISAAPETQDHQIGRVRYSPHRARLLSHADYPHLLQQAVGDDGDIDTFRIVLATTINVGGVSRP